MAQERSRLHSVWRWLASGLPRGAPAGLGTPRPWKPGGGDIQETRRLARLNLQALTEIPWQTRSALASSLALAALLRAQLLLMMEWAQQRSEELATRLHTTLSAMRRFNEDAEALLLDEVEDDLPRWIEISSKTLRLELARLIEELDRLEAPPRH